MLGCQGQGVRVTPSARRATLPSHVGPVRAAINLGVDLVRDRVRVRARARDRVRVRIRGARGACGTLVGVPRTDRPWRLGVKLP